MFVIRGAVKGLRAIAKRIDLFDTEKVKEYLALAEVSEARKEKLTNDLARFYKFKNSRIRLIATFFI